MYLGVDLGTSSIKLLLADKELNILGSASKDLTLYNPMPNYYEENPEEWYQAFLYCLEELKKKFDINKIEALSFSGQMHGLVLLDENDVIIRNAILWNDSRNEKEVDYLNNELGEEFLIKETSNIALCGFTLPKLLWVKKHEPNNFAKIKKIMLPKDYLAYKLNKVFASDKSDMSGSLFYNLEKNVYSAEILKILGLNINVFPKIYNSFEAIGKVKESKAIEIGLSKECKVIIGGGDQATGALGAGILKENEMSISLGTSGTLFATFKNFNFDKQGRIHTFKHVTGYYCFLACTLACANSLKWWTTKVIGTKDSSYVADEIDENSKNNIIFLPYLSGERSPINNPNATGTFFGLNDYYERKDLTKALIEGICFSLYDNFKVFLELGIKPTNIKVIGGMSKNDKIMQVLTDIFGVELVRIQTSEGGGFGAIMLAKKGNEPSWNFEENTKVDKKFTPNLKMHQDYLEKFKKYKEIYSRTKDLM